MNLLFIQKSSSRVIKLFLLFVFILMFVCPISNILQVNASQLTPISDTLTMNPTALSKTVVSGDISVQDVTVSGNYAYALGNSSSSLTVYDVTNPSSPVLKGSSNTALNSPDAVVVSGNYAYVASNGNTSLVVFDISNHANPVEKGSIATGLTSAYSVAVSGNYAYVASEANSSLVVFNETNPVSPSFVTSITIGNPNYVVVQGTYLYVAGGAGLSIYDISTPSSPVFKQTITTGLSWADGLAVQGSYAYVTSWSNNSLVIFNISNPTSISWVGSTANELNNLQAVVVSGNDAFVSSAGNDSLVVFDISTPSTPILVGTTTQNLSWPMKSAVSGNTVYIGNGYDSMSIFNMTGDVDLTGASVTHTLSFKSTSSLAIGKTYTVYLQCNATAAAGFNTVAASTMFIQDGATTIYSGAGTVTGCTSGNVSSFSSLSFIPVVSGAITAGVSIGDTITISDISAINPNTAATQAAPFIIDIKDNNSTPDEGFCAIPISGSNQLTMSIAFAPSITLGLSATALNFGTILIGVNNESSNQVTLSTTTNAVGGESVFVYDQGSTTDSDGAVGGLWTSIVSHKIPCVANTGGGIAVGGNYEEIGVNAGTFSSPGGGTFTVQAPFNSGTVTTIGGYLKNSTTLFALSPGPDGGSATLTWAINSTIYTPAGLYADTVTFLAVGSF